VNKLSITWVFVVVIAMGASAHAQTHSPSKAKQATGGAASMAHKSPAIVPAGDVKWGPAPDAFPSGAQMAVIAGDPSKAGAPFVVRLKMPDAYTIAPHWHPTDENVTVLSGTFQAAMGEKLDESAMKDLETGSFALLPAKMAHYARAKGETIVQVHAMGPFVITYVNPNDDPRKKKTTTN
jgi:uncharacterized RmlC-like cupin family protein